MRNLKIPLTALLISAFIMTNHAQIDKAGMMNQTIIETHKAWTENLNLKSFPWSGTPSYIITFNCFSYPVIQTTSTTCGVVGAAANWAKGRVAVFGHDGYMGMPILRENVLKWAAKKVVIETEILKLNDYMNDEANFLKLNLKKYKIIELNSCPTKSYSKEFYSTIERYVRNGGAFIISYPGWVITTYKGFSSVSEAPINKLLNIFGLHLTDGYLGGDMQAPGIYPIIDVGSSYFATLSGFKKKEQQDSVIFALQNLPLDLFTASREINSTFNKLSLLSSSIKFPIDNKDYMNKIAAIFLSKKLDNINILKAAPSIELFPGVINNNSQKLKVKVIINNETQNSWISTGYYLSAGEILKVEVLEGKQNGWYIRIGCHSDRLYHKEKWQRFPEITKSVPINGLTSVKSPFGGLIYLESTKAAQGPITVELENVVEAPFYDINQPQRQWNPSAGAPWAEIQGKYLTMSIPSNAVREETNPKRIAEFWDKIIENDHILRGTSPSYRERFVSDIDISAGYMHSGYPIMTFLDVVTSDSPGKKVFQLDIDYLEKWGSWGHFHEVGHNMQRGWWTFEGTGEVTNNIFSLWGGYICCQIPVLTNEWIKGKYENAAKALNDRINLTSEEVYDFYKGDPGIFLVQYALIQHYFGWETYKKVFAGYENDNNLRPSQNQDKIDTWIIELSKASGKNLLPYYELWKLPFSENAVNKLKSINLQFWLPPDDDIVLKNLNKDYISKIKIKYGL